MSDDVFDIFKHTPNLMPSSLAGATVRPIEGGTFSGACGVPEKFFAEDSDMDALERYLDSGEDPSLPMRTVAFKFERPKRG